jgi:hypothetical protein
MPTPASYWVVDNGSPNEDEEQKLYRPEIAISCSGNKRGSVNEINNALSMKDSSLLT